MDKSDNNDYKRFYSVLTKAVEAYQRGLSQAIEQNYQYENQIKELKEELLKSKELIKYLKNIGAKHRKSPLAKEEVEKHLNTILNMDNPNGQMSKRLIRSQVNQRGGGNQNNRSVPQRSD